VRNGDTSIVGFEDETETSFEIKGQTIAKAVLSYLPENPSKSSF